MSDVKKQEVSIIYNDECRNCDGDGFIEVGPHCSKPASMCCGGCYHKEECERCSGSGEVEVEFLESELIEALELIRDGLKNQAIENILERFNDVNK